MEKLRFREGNLLKIIPPISGGVSCSNQVSDKTHTLHLAETFLKSLLIYTGLLLAYCLLILIIITTPVYSFTLQGIQLSPVLSYLGECSRRY